MNRSKGNMYENVTHTHNEISGSCMHACTYCYMKAISGINERPLVFRESANKEDLGSGNFIFVGSSIDMWAEDIPSEWIRKVLDHCQTYENDYLFQSKNPARFLEFKDHPVMQRATLLTTIETNRWYDAMGKAPRVEERAEAMSQLAAEGFKTGVTIEPVMAFDYGEMLKLVTKCSPSIVYVGKNTYKPVLLEEPTPKEVIDLCLDLKREGCSVRLKKNITSYVRQEFILRKSQKSK